VLVIGVVYIVYGFVRNQFGSAKLHPGDEPRHSFNNAVHVINIEKAMGIFHEAAIQDWFSDGWYKFFNIFYGTAHFIVTLGILVWLFVKRRSFFGRWRTTLMATTVLALIGFALFPLMPPRLMNATPTAPCRQEATLDACIDRYGGGELADEAGLPNYGYLDTLRDVGGLWSFDSKQLDSVSNQYAAMPSLHIGWSTWCMLVLLRFSRRRITKVLAVVYPLLTLLVIVATANHYIIDAAGGIAIVAAGYGIARGIEAVLARGKPVAAEVDGASEDVLVNS
jgi:hypothetical protein